MENQVAGAFPQNSIIHARTIRELAKKTRLYVIFIMARSGSTWLMEMAENSGALGTPQEWFNEGWIHTSEDVLGCRPPQLAGTRDVDEYLRRTVSDYRSPTNVMGIQLSQHQTACLCDMLEDPEDACRIVAPFYLRRRDLVAQAISLYRSVQSGFFHSYQTTSTLRSRFDAVEYNSDHIVQWCEHLVAGEIFFESTFARWNLRPARFTYEDIVADPENILSWMAHTIDPNEKSQIAARSDKLKTLGNQISEEWCERFRLERADYITDLDARRPEVVSDIV